MYALATVVVESDDDETEPRTDDDDEDDDDFDRRSKTEIDESFVNSLNEKISQWQKCPLL